MSSPSHSPESDLQIKVAAGDSLKAKSPILRAFSDTARGLPADSKEWDVSGLLLDGQPFSRDTVSCWLSCAYAGNAGDGVTELGPQDIQQLSTVTGLTQVLAFADAVGTHLGHTSGLYTAAYSQVQQLKLVVHLPEHRVLELPLTGRAYFWIAYPFGEQQLSRFDLGCWGFIGPRLDCEEQRLDMQEQVARQLSALLRLGHMLRLQQLLDVLHQFFMLNARPNNQYLLSGVAGLVFSDAVLEAALSSSALSREAYISSVMSQPCSLTPDGPGRVGHSRLLKPLGFRQSDTRYGIVEFEAELLQDFAGGKAGDTVKAVLDLFGMLSGAREITLYLRSDRFVRLPVQLLLGHTFSDPAALEGLLGRPAP